MKNDTFRKWNRFQLTYSIWDYNPALQKEKQVKAIRWAFKLWSDSTQLQFEQLGDGVAADIELRWGTDRPSDNGWANPPPGSNGQKPEDGNIWFNLNRRWTFEERDTAAEPLDFLTICAHEIGHSIGLGHANAMTPTLMVTPYDASKRHLSMYELNCYTALYGSHLRCTFFPDDVIEIRCS